MVHTIKSSTEFDKLIHSAGNKSVLVDFYATWCGPCKMMDPVVRSLEKKYRDDAVFIKVNVDKLPEISDYYKIRSLPTFIFIKNGRKVSGFSGADAEKLKAKMAKYAN